MAVFQLYMGCNGILEVSEASRGVDFAWLTMQQILLVH